MAVSLAEVALGRGRAAAEVIRDTAMAPSYKEVRERERNYHLILEELTTGSEEADLNSCIRRAAQVIRDTKR